MNTRQTLNDPDFDRERNGGFSFDDISDKYHNYVDLMYWYPFPLYLLSKVDKFFQEVE
jgi:hypothetical protein